MLTPGDTWISVAGTGHEASKFWNAFFNPTYWPSLLLRSGVCTSLAGIWALITSSRIDGDKQYPDDLEGEVHADGEIWSAALWSIHGSLGHTKADTVILEAQFAFTADISMPDAARATVAAAQRLYGTSTANTVRAAFQARGIL